MFIVNCVSQIQRQKPSPTQSWPSDYLFLAIDSLEWRLLGDDDYYLEIYMIMKVKLDQVVLRLGAMLHNY